MKSNNEKNLIIELMDKGKRYDGRAGNVFRDVQIEYNVSKNAEGSATVKVGNTEVIAGVKLDVSEPYSDSKDQGNIVVNAEFSQVASPDFEGGPPSNESVELARVVDRAIRESKAIDLKQLCIKEGEKVWNVFIDLYTINHDGNLIDASSLAAMAALLKARIPKLDKDGKVEYGVFTSKNVPLTCIVSTTTIAKIGKHLIVDPSLKEEMLADARISIGTSGDTIHSLQKGGDGGFTEEEIEQSVDLAIKENKKIQKLLKK